MNVNQKGKGLDIFETPDFIYRQLNRKFCFTLDAACSTENCKSKKGAYIDKGINGLNLSWRGERVFCNPPFSEKAKWIEKASNEVLENGCETCVMILPVNSMDSAPWHDFIYGNFHYDILKSRISFIDPETGSPKKGNNSGTVIVYFWRKISTHDN